MLSERRPLLWFAVFALCGWGAWGCSRAKVVRGPEGTAHLTCSRGMKDCINQAQKVCDGDGYTILGGASRKVLLGARDSPYRKESESGRLDIRCGSGEPSQRKAVKLFKLPPRTDEQVQAGETAPGSPAAPASPSSGGTCVPGATQRCIGPGACEGGQSCLADGSGFGVCDCGGSAPATATPRSGKSPAASAEAGEEPGAPDPVVGPSGDPERPVEGQPAPPPAESLAD